ncbi:hypothetical protein AALP_AA7G073600 [Arabis alpina]|uniref:Uncharacterized protein n=1 Tax=Arabis alpina TaxID=50452 RepID=A0A087GGI3_ARAAL|nr:hypothetical protein AALP_AA7G073600 [Arabis alpina]
MSGYSKMDPTTDQKPDPVDTETRNADQDPPVQMQARLSRNKSVSASGQAVQSTMKSAMSMRRSSSVSERYCRIYDQSSATWPLPFHEEDGEEEDDKDKVVKKKSNNLKKRAFVKACKRFFGIS